MHCDTCTCKVEVEKKAEHAHLFSEVPSYIITTGTAIERVWMCQNKSGAYCHESKRKVEKI